jgi:uncharacterized protein (DUF1330 family)
MGSTSTEESGMPAYSLAMVTIRDPQKYEEYRAIAGPAMAKYGGKFVCRGTELSLMEGQFSNNRVVIAEFPDLETAKNFYRSPEYQSAKGRRTGAAEFNLVFFESKDKS